MGRRIGTLGLLALLPACWDSPSSPDGSARFNLKNSTDRPLFVQVGGHEFGPGLPVTLLLDNGGNPLARSLDPCGLGDCEDPERGQRACPPVLRLPEVQEIAPGESFSETWDGYFFQSSTEESCLEKVAGEGEFKIRLCWGHLQSSNSEIGLVTCETKRFTLDGETDVEHVISSIPQDMEPPGAVRVRLENRRQAPIFVTSSIADCSGQSPWLEILDASELPAQLFPLGAICGGIQPDQKNEVGPARGGAADIACIGPQPQQIDPGSSAENHWTGLVFDLLIPEGGPSCARQRSAVGRTFSARACFGDGLNPNGFGPNAVLNPVCTSAQFTVAKQPVDVILAATEP